MREVLIAVIGILGGGFGVKFLDGVFNIGTKRLDDSILFRKEILEKVKDLEKRLDQVSREVDEWQDKYYKLLIQYSTEKEEWKQKYLDLQEVRSQEKEDHQQELNHAQEKFNKVNNE